MALWPSVAITMNLCTYSILYTPNMMMSGSWCCNTVAAKVSCSVYIHDRVVRVDE